MPPAITHSNIGRDDAESEVEHPRFSLDDISWREVDPGGVEEGHEDEGGPGSQGLQER